MIDPASMARVHAAAFASERPWSTDEFSALLDTPGTFAVGDERAFALVRVVADEAELLTIATHPGHRRQGLARELMSQWRAMAATKGATSGFLEVASDNSTAIALYDSCGFEVVGRRRGYYRRDGALPADALLMRCQLDAATTPK